MIETLGIPNAGLSLNLNNRGATYQNHTVEFEELRAATLKHHQNGARSRHDQNGH